MKTQPKNTLIHLILMLGILSVIPTNDTLYAQGRVREVVIPEGGVDQGSFPEIRVRAIVSDETRARVAGLTEASFILQEDGEQMPFELSEIQVGIQVVFILDASLDTRQLGSTGYSRLEEGKQVIYGFAQHHMAEGVDQVAVLAPESSTRFNRIAPLPGDPTEFTPFVNTVHDGTYLYELPEDISATPLNDMVASALDMLARNESGMHKAVVVISDGIDVISDREVADIVNKANDLNVPIYTVIFGPPNNWGGQPESNMKRLSLDTLGAHFQLSSAARKPEPLEDLIELESLYEKLTSQRDQYLLIYESGVASSGIHEVAVAAGGQSGARPFRLNIKPPDVSIGEPVAGAEIVRQTDDPDTPAEDLEPRVIEVVFQVSWPDGYERQVEKVDLLVDNVATLDTCMPPCDRVIWNLALLPEGPHSLRIRVRDQQGLEAESDEVALTISLHIPTASPTVTPTTGPGAQETAAPGTTPAPPSERCEEMYSGLNRIVRCNQNVLLLVLGALGVVGGLVIVRLIRKPRPPTPAPSRASAPYPQTIPVPPVRSALATLTVLKGDHSYTEPISIFRDNTRLGRNPDLVDVVFDNRSVSRHHANITIERDDRGRRRFVLYDRDSASGTYVNSVEVGRSGQQLQDDDKIQLGGEVELRFNITRDIGDMDTIASRPKDRRREPERVEDDFETSPDANDDAMTQDWKRGLFDAPSPASGGEADQEDHIDTEKYVPGDFDL
jgi:hypothetical protein